LEKVKKFWSGILKLLTVRFVLDGHSKNVKDFAISKDGILATTSEDKRIILWDIESGQQKNIIKSSEEIVTSLIFSNDGSKLASAGVDKKIRIWDIKTGAMELEINTTPHVIKKIKFSPDNQIIFSVSDNVLSAWNTINGLLDNELTKPHGNASIISFDLSKDGNYFLLGASDKKFSIWNRKNANIFLSEKLSNPILAAVFSPDGKNIFTSDFSENLNIWDASSLNIKIPETDIKKIVKSDFKAPLIEISTPGLSRDHKPVVKKDTYTVSGKISDENGIMLVFLNGTELKLSSNGEFSSTVMLKDGDNVINIKAIDVNGNRSEENLLVNLSRDGFLSDNENTENTNYQGKYYALIIGISEYQDRSIPSLDDFPTNDAKTLAELLISDYIFNPENVSILKNPTRRDILVAMDNLSKSITEEDNLLIFYAGHGYYERENDIGYWLPSDAEQNFTANWIYNNNLVDLIKKIRSRHTLLISDACFSGSIFRGRDATFMQDASKAYLNLYALKSRKAMTSGNLKTVPNKSMFFEYLTKNLRFNADKYMSSRELFGKLARDVGNNTDNVPQWGDIYGIGDEGGDFIFIKRN
jgi:WD40 repeat protein